MSTSGILPINSHYIYVFGIAYGGSRVIAMAKNGNFNKKHSNKLMRMRVLFQGIAVFVFAAIYIYQDNNLRS